ncbi:hypothetical protein C0995_000737 [Termitomyces sp. Mi166|nr:hypothetical protein C0995_000737 [Termitomyces sp. Mi166\
MLSWTRLYTHQLVELVLYHMKFDSFLEFAEGLRQFKVLRHLAVIRTTWGSSMMPSTMLEASEGQDQAPVPPIRSLVLNGTSVGLVWWLLARSVKISRLDLELPDFGVGSSNAICLDVGQYLRPIGTNLEELDLRQEYHNTIDLSANTNIRALWFHNIRLSRGDWVISTLARVTFLRLQMITLHVFWDDSRGHRAQVNEFDWRALGLIIGSAPLKTWIRKLRIYWLGYNDVRESTAELMRILAEQIPSTVECTVLDSVPLTATRFTTISQKRVFDRRHRV